VSKVKFKANISFLNVLFLSTNHKLFARSLSAQHFILFHTAPTLMSTTTAQHHAENKTVSVERYNELSAQLNKLKLDLQQAEAELAQHKQKFKQQQQENPKAEKTPEFKACEQQIKKLKDDVGKLTKEWRRADPNKLVLDRTKFEEHLTRRFFVVPSFEIYGGTAGLYDFGPMACAIKNNVINLWRRHFILEENMLELDLTCLTPEPVFKASGHVQRFADWMVKDEKTNTCYRADKLLAEVIENELDQPNITPKRQEELRAVLKAIDGYSGAELGAKIKELGIVAPETKNPLSDPYPFNLMFSTQIGPTGKQLGYLRPETAQGIFVNFRRLLDFNGGQLPFAGATIGQAFRNEIAPRSGLLRVREFTLAEIEHFMNPATAKDPHPKLHKVKDVSVPFFSRERQSAGLNADFMTIGEALEKGILQNSTLAYFIGRTYLFMRAVGILKSGIRFRQHMGNEMAHYASDCWDCELLTSYGWIECVGLADRSCYDLQAHSADSKVDLVAYEAFKTPQTQEVWEFQIADKAKYKKFLQKYVDPVTKHLTDLKDEQKQSLQKELEEKGKITLPFEDKTFELSKEMIQFKLTTKKITGRHFTPAVIEPSFGIGRIIYCLLEHAYWVRPQQAGDEDDKIARVVLSFPPAIAPYKTAILPLQQNDQFDPFISQLSDMLTNAGISHKVDTTTASVGKRYARIDDIGVPFAITIDFTSLKDNTVTLRERDSCTQIRAPVEEVVKLINQLIESKITWEAVRALYPEQKQTASAKVGKQQ
jgi:glycyl-tRNA synthetase